MLLIIGFAEGWYEHPRRKNSRFPLFMLGAISTSSLFLVNVSRSLRTGELRHLHAVSRLAPPNSLCDSFAAFRRWPRHTYAQVPSWDD